jgi:hypothetical protein
MDEIRQAMRFRFPAAVLFVLLPFVAEAHVGSPDIYLEGTAGPYKLFVTVRTPTVIPGVAELEVRAETPGITRLSAVPLPLTGPGAKFAPVPDQLTRSTSDPQFFSGGLWMMAPGSWQIRIAAQGDHGTGTIAIPVPSAAAGTKKMTGGLALILTGLMSFLVLGAVAMAGASVREATLNPGVEPDHARRIKGQRTMAVAFVLVLIVLWFGYRWWGSEDASYREDIYKPMTMTPSLQGSVLTIALKDPGWLNSISDFRRLPVVRKVDDLVLDHGHLMHLYLLREPGLDVVYHLHPDLVSAGVFRLSLPTMPAGTYKLYGDIVHENGFPETVAGSIAIPAIHGRANAGDDASAVDTAWQQSPATSTEFALPDGYRMRWLGAPAALHARQPLAFQFELVDGNGKAPADMALYMGMVGHAAFVKTDGSVFAHIHPNGSISMPAYMKANGMSDSAMSGMNMAGMKMQIPNAVSFPYGLPSPGRYRIFVQMKHGQTVETGVFDAIAN